MLSIIIPTFNEEENVRAIAKSIGAVLEEIDYEIIFVDDSNDQTLTLLTKLAEKDKRIKVFHRSNERGLASAVVLGFSRAHGEIICVIDADLQHPPEMIPKIYRQIKKGADLVIPSRFIPGGSDRGLVGVRKLISWAARQIAWVFLREARLSTDPLGGFFIFRRKVLEGIKLNPIGWKILLEILVKTSYSKIIEIPYQFKSRDGGISKMGLREQIDYLRHIIRLVYSSPSNRRFWSFSLIGLSGVAVNLFIFTELIKLLNFDPLLAGVLSACVAIISNFFLNRTFTWPDFEPEKSVKHLSLFFLFSVIGIMINLSGLYLLTRFGQVNIYISQIMAIALATFWNFMANSRFNWKERPIQPTKEIITQNEESLA